MTFDIQITSCAIEPAMSSSDCVSRAQCRRISEVNRSAALVGRAPPCRPSERSKQLQQLRLAMNAGLGEDGTELGPQRMVRPAGAHGNFGQCSPVHQLGRQVRFRLGEVDAPVRRTVVSSCRSSGRAGFSLEIVSRGNTGANLARREGYSQSLERGRRPSEACGPAPRAIPEPKASRIRRRSQGPSLKSPGPCTRPARTRLGTTAPLRVKRIARTMGLRRPGPKCARDERRTQA